MRNDITHGDGMYRSRDGGASWTHIGLDDSRQIARIVVDPHDANTLLVAALGHAYAANDTRGVYRSTDGGATWTRTLFTDRDTGAADLAADPSGQVVFASLWRARRPPWNSYPPSNGPGGGLHVSKDGGKTWAPVRGNGFPESTASAFVGKIGVAVAPSMPSRVFAIVDTDAARGGLYRSDDGGVSWVRISDDIRLWGRCWYFCHVTVDTKDAGVVYVSNLALYRSMDGGRSFAAVDVRASAARFKAIKGSPDGDDYHQLWIDPVEPSRMILAVDQGASISIDGGASWSTWFNQPTGQFYTIATDRAFPYNVYASQQDSGSLRMASRSPHVGIQERDWQPIFGLVSENSAMVPDPRDPDRVYGDQYPPGLIFRDDRRTSVTRITTPTLGVPASWRSEWVMPIAIGPDGAVYWSQQVVFRTRDHGARWTAASPDLSRQEIVVPPNLDRWTADTPPYKLPRGLVYAIAPSPLRANVVWAGTDDGLVYRTDDAQAAHPSWKRVTPRGITPWAHIDAIDASQLDANSAYVAVDRHRLDDDTPYVYVTHDAGRTWRESHAGIAADDYVHVVRADPVRRGLLFAGTEHGVYVSFDDGGSWRSLRLNMPYAPIYDLTVHGDDVVVATHGRGLWILDDIAPLRDVAGGAPSGARLFPIADAVRMQPGSDMAERLPLEIPVGENPPNGAFIDYRVPDGAHGPLQLAVLRNGARIRQWSSADAPDPGATDPFTATYIPGYVAPGYPPSVRPGMNRFVWDFTALSSGGPLAPPGRYTVQMTLDGKTYAQSLTVRRDPRSRASDADLQEQYRFVLPMLDLSGAVSAALKEAACIENTYPGKYNGVVDPIAGVPYRTPDDPYGPPATNFTTLNYFKGALRGLIGSVESADGPPIPQERYGWRIASAGARAALSRWRAADVPHGCR